MDFLNDAFVSIIEPLPKGKEDVLLVRARDQGHIERTFGKDVKVQRTPARDYLFRALIPRAKVAEAIARHITNIDYVNFKDSIPDTAAFNNYYHACSDVWRTMLRLQQDSEFERKRHAASRKELSQAGL